MVQTNAPDGPASLCIRAGPVTSASWRTTVLLGAGHYRFEGAVSTTGVEPLNFGKNQGATLRVTGFPRGQQGHPTGNTRWQTVRVEFEVRSEQEVELVCELRARSGDAWFDSDSLRLIRLD
jgi:hypothetical protein